MNAIGVFGVLAGAYAGRNPKLESTLTHAAEVGPDGWEFRVLCRGVKFENLCDQVMSGPPTCPTCAKRAAKEPKR